MRAVQITGFGGPEVLVIGEVPIPAPAADEVLVRVAAVGINPVDWKVREGYAKEFIPFHFPTTIGGEFAGTITALGEGVTDFAVGDEVHGMTGMIGAFAEYAVVKITQIALKPSRLSFVEAAAVPAAAFTAVTTLNAGKVGAGTRILIHSAAGGVGSMAVQLAHLRGAEVTALASPANIEFVKSLGATHVVDRTTAYEDQIGDFDVVLDAYGPEAQARSWQLLRRGGALLSLVAPPDQAQATAFGVRAEMVIGQTERSGLEEVDRLIADGSVRLKISRTYAFADIGQALIESQAGKVQGKLIATV
ncbi:MAG: hypothetical protein JWM78_2561 [Verrucomicrobiaceae bacterium]|nr:hypothetical protein [Verrucomicrobiaceae bacterium]